jgi:hypothetical protein
MAHAQTITYRCSRRSHHVIMTMVSYSRKLGISSTAVSQAVERGKKIAGEHKFVLMSD